MKTVTMTRDLPFPPDRVWRAIATGALLAEWLLPNDFKPEPGHRFTFQSTPMPQWDGVIQAEVGMVDPPHHLTYSWVALGVVTEVSFTLQPTDTGTRLTMAQSGFQDDQPQNYNGARFGWQNFLNRLDALLTKEG